MSGRHDDATQGCDFQLDRRCGRQVEEISRIVKVAAVFRASELLPCNRGPRIGENVHFERSKIGEICRGYVPVSLFRRRTGRSRPACADPNGGYGSDRRRTIVPGYFGNRGLRYDDRNRPTGGRGSLSPAAPILPVAVPPRLPLVGWPRPPRHRYHGGAAGVPPADDTDGVGNSDRLARAPKLPRADLTVNEGAIGSYFLWAGE